MDSFSFTAKDVMGEPREFYVDHEKIILDDTQVELSELTAYYYMRTNHTVGSGGPAMRSTFVIMVRDTSGDTVQFRWQEGIFGSDTETSWSEICLAIHHWIVVPTLNRIYSTLMSGEEFHSKKCSFTPKGIKFKTKKLFGKEQEHFVLWEHINHVGEGTGLSLYSIYDSNAELNFGLSDLEATLVGDFLKWILSDRKLREAIYIKNNL